jgi:hypothetical protein
MKFPLGEKILDWDSPFFALLEKVPNHSYLKIPPEEYHGWSTHPQRGNLLKVFAHHMVVVLMLDSAPHSDNSLYSTKPS